jgi:hypothetical protein
MNHIVHSTNDGLHFLIQHNLSQFYLVIFIKVSCNFYERTINLRSISPHNLQVVFSISGSSTKYKIVIHTFPLCATDTLICFWANHNEL